jgi:diguanylate cyclase (GGDEF)-like protein
MNYQRSLEKLVAVVQQLSLARSQDHIIRIVRTAARELTGADGAAFVLREKEQCYYAGEDAIAPLWKGQRFPIDFCISGWVMKNRQSCTIPDVFDDDRIPHDLYRTTFVRSLVMVPIRTVDPMGAIGIYWSTTHAATLEQVQVLQALADAASIAMENAQFYAELEQRVRVRTAELEAMNLRLQDEIAERRQAEERVRQLSLTDELTGLHNRRGFFLFATQELKLSRRMNSCCTLLYIDLNGLKQANDRFGHEVGDAMIVDAARLLKQIFRETDVITRLGGDEFAIFALHGVASPTALTNRLQENLDRFNRRSGKPYQLSMSVGVVSTTDLPSATLEQMLIEADRLMYENKRGHYRTRGQQPSATASS